MFLYYSDIKRVILHTVFETVDELRFQTLELCAQKSYSMGSAIGVNFPNGSPTNKTSIEYFAFKVLQSEYERSKLLSTGETEDSDMVIPTEEPYYFQRMVLLYQEALQESKKPLQECRSPSVILYKYDTMSEAERKEYHDAVLDAALTKEKVIAKKTAANNKVQDYSQSFGGTAADTKNEKEAAAILRGETAADNEEEEQQSLYPYLIPPNIEHSYDQQQLRRYGKWGRFLGGTGCYLYIHYLTKEVVSLRPDEYEEEVTITTNANNIPEAQKDPANGIQRIDLENLQSEIDKIIQETKKTPLLLDPSQSGVVRAFFSYKGQLEVRKYVNTNPSMLYNMIGFMYYIKKYIIIPILFISMILL